MKRLMVVVLIVLLSIMPIFAAGQQEKSMSGSDASEDEVKTITVFQFKIEYGDGFEKLNQEFMKLHPDIKIVMDNVPSPPYFDALKAKKASNEMPDIFNLLAGRSFVEPWKSQCVDLSDEPWIQDLAKGAVDALTAADGTLVGAPYILDGYGMIYNKDLFAKAGIEKAPTTISELEAAAKKLEAAGIQPFICSYNDVPQFVRRMYTIPFAKRDNYNDYFQNVVINGGDFSNDPVFYEYLDFIDLTKKYGNKDALTLDFNTERSAFLNGEGAMIPGEGMWMQTIADNAGIDINMGLMTIPISDDKEKEDIIFTIPQSLCINNESPYIEECKEYIEFLLTSEAGAEFLSSIKGFPAYLETSIDISAYGPLAVDFNSFILRNKSSVMLGASFPSAAQENIMAAMQKYYAGVENREDTVKAIEKTWNDNLEEY